MKKLVIFDLDGTLTDTSVDIMDNLNLTLEKFGFPTITLKETVEFVGNGARKLVERALKGKKPENFEEILAYYNKSYNFCGSPKTYAYDGVTDLLKTLEKSGYMLVILSNKPQDGANEVVKKFFGDVNFSLVFGQREGVKPKPDGQAVKIILDTLGVLKEETLFVGDSDVDIKTAINAEVDNVAVLWGYRDKDVLINAGAKNFATVPDDIILFLNRK